MREVLATGIDTEAIRVVGDLGIPAGQAGAMHTSRWIRSTFRPAARAVMEGIREGGVVLAVKGEAAGVEQILRRHGAKLVETTSEAAANPSHNAAE